MYLVFVLFMLLHGYYELLGACGSLGSWLMFLVSEDLFLLHSLFFLHLLLVILSLSWICLCKVSLCHFLTKRGKIEVTFLFLVVFYFLVPSVGFTCWFHIISISLLSWRECVFYSHNYWVWAFVFVEHLFLFAY